jgi:hypothetical protein
VNVSGSMTAGTVTSKLLGQTDFAIFNATDAVPAALPGTAQPEQSTHPVAV